MKTHRCVGWALAAASLGVAWTAWAQDPVMASTSSDPLLDWAARLLQGGGLPAVLGALGWLAGRGSLQLPISGSLTLALHEEDRRLVRRLVRAIDDGPITQPGAPRRPDDSEDDR